MDAVHRQAPEQPAERPPSVSVLFPRPEKAAEARAAREPPCFRDLNLDQVVAAITRDREEYGLEPFLYSPLRDPGEVRYRHEVFADLAQGEVRAAIERFAERMRLSRRYLKLARDLRHRYERERLFLDAAAAYCEAVTALAQDLRGLGLRSRALRALREHVLAYAGSPPFTELAAEARQVAEALAAVRYLVAIRGPRVSVGEPGGGPDYSAEIEDAFARFRQGEVRDYRVKFRETVGLDHVEARILELVARLDPGPFAALGRFCERHAAFVEPTLGAFDREVQLYLAYVEHCERLRAAGLSFCLPEIAATGQGASAEGAYDLALAASLIAAGRKVVPNGFRLTPPERILVVTGPNQGGKTTFARMVGQLHSLAALGFPVPARRARLPLADAVLAHFEREEESASLRGKLEADLLRLRDLLGRASPRSVLILNESLASTTLEDARLLGAELIERIARLGSLAVYVTFVDELSALNRATVSMVAEVDPRDPAERTYRVVRRPADGRAYALALARKHGLTYEALRERVGA